MDLYHRLRRRVGHLDRDQRCVANQSLGSVPLHPAQSFSVHAGCPSGAGHYDEPKPSGQEGPSAQRVGLRREPPCGIGNPEPLPQAEPYDRSAWRPRRHAAQPARASSGRTARSKIGTVEKGPEIMAATTVPSEVKVAQTPPMPTFKTAGEERLHRKQRLASAFRLFAKFGFVEGVAGHITVRDPERTDHFWVNPFGMHFAHIRVSDLVMVDERGAVVEGDRPVNESAFAIHSRVHAARPDVVAAAHAHSLYGKTWSSLGRLLDPLTQDACAFYEDHSLFADYTGVVYDMSEGDRIAQALGPRKAVIMQNHGNLTVGSTVDEAAFYYITMDRSCQSQLMAEAAGKPIPIAHEAAIVARKQVGNPRVAWFQYQPLYDLIVREQPDLLD